MNRFDFDCIEKERESFRNLFTAFTSTYEKNDVTVKEIFTITFSTGEAIEMVQLELVECEPYGISFLGDRLYKNDRFMITKKVWEDLLDYTNLVLPENAVRVIHPEKEPE